jgi:LemA protein
MATILSRPFPVLFVVISGLFLSACGINTIPTYEERAKAAWSDVQNQYQRRADLIPNLVETVKGFARQEEKVLTEVVEARAKATQMTLPADILTDPEKFRQYQEVQGQLGAALGRLIAITENYPDLKSNQNFLALQSQLEGTENRIAVSRRDYIESVRLYNTELKTFPGRLWAMFLYTGNKPMETFTVPEEKTQTPEVKFD